jgi:hypothetical protein
VAAECCSYLAMAWIDNWSPIMIRLYCMMKSSRFARYLCRLDQTLLFLSNEATEQIQGTHASRHGSKRPAQGNINGNGSRSSSSTQQRANTLVVVVVVVAVLLMIELQYAHFAG